MEKLPAIPGKAADYRRYVKRPIIEIDQIDAPLPRSWIVETKRLRFDAKFLIGARHVELFEVRVAIEKFMVIRNAIVHDPGIGIIEAVGEPADVRFPVADEEVKIVRTIALREVCRIRGCLRRKRTREHQAEYERRKALEFADVQRNIVLPSRL